MEAILQATGIIKKYNNKIILDDISLSVHKGEAIALVGINGCGKSTLLRILSGVTNPTSGKVRITGTPGMALIPDHFERANMTVRRFMKHVQDIDGGNYEEKNILDYFKLFHIENMTDTPMKYLSKGTLQKAAVIQALASEADILFMDEPLSGQDTLSQMLFVREIKERKERGQSVIMCCHDDYLIDELADKIMQIHDGKLTDGYDYIYGSRKKKGLLFARAANDEMLQTLLNRLPAEAAVQHTGRVVKLEINIGSLKPVLALCMELDMHIIKYEEVEEAV